MTRTFRAELPRGATKPPAGAEQQEDEDGSDCDAIWSVATLPKPLQRDDHVVTVGAVVCFHAGWDFFSAEEPAYVYGCAGRMGAAPGVTIRKAALRGQYLDSLERDFKQLYLGDHIERSRENDAYYIQRFAAGLRERTPPSSHWWPAAKPPTARTW